MQLQRTFASLLATLSVVYSQQVGTLTTETHPGLSVKSCAAGGTCTTQASSVVLDANWRWLHTTSGYTNCYTGSTFNSTICSSPTTCSSSCALDGADYSSVYGITTSSDSLTLKFVTKSQGTNIGSRVYLMEPGSTSKYRSFNLLNQEFTFTVDVSKLPCGLNGALYFTAMEADGGVSKYPANKAGAKYGTGYCDAQCPRDLKFINGVANTDGWVSNPTDPNAGTGNLGSCCSEMDIWEANSISTAYTPHPCSSIGQATCTGTQCSAPGTDQGICDQPGCDFNSYRLGQKEFYGPGKTLNTNSPMTVVTQFLTTDNTTAGDLKEIRRIYIQNGVVIQNSKTTIPGVAAYDSITEPFCTEQKAAFGDSNAFAAKGGLVGMGKAFKLGMVLVMSIWDDHLANMLWLDSNYPLDKAASAPGVARGTCSTDSGKPEDVEANSPNAQVIFSDIKFGPIGSTFSSGGGGGGTVTQNPPTSTTSTAPSATQTKYGQCGGQDWKGPTACASGSTCTLVNQWYSQCL